jgi:uncharacterized protein (DUF58 family)
MDAARWLEAGEPQSNLRLGGPRSFLALIGFALIGAWSGHQALVYLIVGLLGLVGLARLLADRALLDVTAHHELIDRRAFPDEQLRVRLVTTNRKALPLLWLRARSAVPPALTPVSARRRWPGLDRGGYLQGLAAMSWHSAAVWEFDLPCRARGVYRLGPIELLSGDPFGLYCRRRVEPAAGTVVIYPRIVPLRRLGFASAAELGQARPRRAIQDDPTRTAGVRSYRPGDPLRRVHWKATARSGELQLRILEPAATSPLMLVLAAETFDFPWTRYREDIFELAVSALASIAWRATEDGAQVGLLANTPLGTRVAPAAHPGHLTLILEALAHASPSSSVSLPVLLSPERRGLTPATYVIASGRGTPALSAGLARLQSARMPVTLLYGDDPPRDLPGLRGYRLRQWDDLATTLESSGELLDAR